MDEPEVKTKVKGRGAGECQGQVNARGSRNWEQMGGGVPSWGGGLSQWELQNQSKDQEGFPVGIG